MSHPINNTHIIRLDSCHTHTVPCCDILKSSFNAHCKQQAKCWTPPFPTKLSYLINHFNFSVSCRRRQPDLFRLDTKMLFTVLCASHLHFCRRHLDSLLKSCCWDLLRSKEVGTSGTQHQQNGFNSDIRAGRQAGRQAGRAVTSLCYFVPARHGIKSPVIIFFPAQRLPRVVFFPVISRPLYLRTPLSFSLSLSLSLYVTLVSHWQVCCNSKPSPSVPSPQIQALNSNPGPLWGFCTT